MTSDDPPPVKNYAGRWDEYLAAAFVFVPWVVAGIAAVYLVATGQLTFTGQIPTEALAYVATALFVVTYALALAKLFGARALSWILTRAHNAARNYNP